MTRREKLESMRTRDLVELALKMNVKVSQTRGQLKEARAGVIDRILAAEQGGIPTVEDLVQEFIDMPDDANLAELFEKVGLLSEDDQKLFMDKVSGLSN